MGGRAADAGRYEGAGEGWLKSAYPRRHKTHGRAGTHTPVKGSLLSGSGVLTRARFLLAEVEASILPEIPGRPLSRSLA